MDTLPEAPPRAALFLDFDGTLVDIAPTPDAVLVPPDLPALLARLSDRLEGALAVVSGRPAAQLAALLPAPLMLAGDHGATLRPPAEPRSSPRLPDPPRLIEAAQRLAAVHPARWWNENRTASSALPPGAEAASRAGAAGRLLPGQRFALLPARMAWE